ncbi:MAG: MBL fold metallo-hydrolase [Anaerolineae bacterium]|nr:MBL fold metallo-hydrolase [Anaerolineae bacterium]
MVTNAHQVAPDIYQLRIPLPYLLNHVYCYVLRDTGGWTIMDTGLNWPDARAAWALYFEQLGINPKTDIQKIIITHMHPDHFGMAGWLQGQSGAPVYISGRDGNAARRVWYEWKDRVEDMRTFFQTCALPETMMQKVLSAGNETALLTAPLPERIESINGGDQLVIGERVFSVISAPGHSDGQILFYHAPEELLISGDHVLMKITPNIGLWPETESAPLSRYLASLTALRDLPVKLALPGHKSVIQHWQKRIEELQTHHMDRLALLQQAASPGVNVYEATGKIFDLSRLTPHEIRFAIAETLAHLEHLHDAHLIEREDGEIFTFHG